MSNNAAANQHHLTQSDREYHMSEHQQRGQDAYLLPLLSPLEIKDETTFADLGCGSGYINAYLAVRRRLQCNIGLELDLSALLLAKELNAGARSICWLCASAEFIPLASTSVDVVVCRGVVPLARAEHVIAEIGRILKRGGRATILLHPWTFYLSWLTFDPRRWKRAAAGLIHFSLGLWFNLTGHQIQVHYRGKRIGQTWQTVSRMHRLLRKYDLELFKVSRDTEFFVYVVKSGGANSRSAQNSAQG